MYGESNTRFTMSANRQVGDPIVAAKRNTFPQLSSAAAFDVRGWARAVDVHTLFLDAHSAALRGGVWYAGQIARIYVR